jgi:hypothetical protein
MLDKYIVHRGAFNNYVDKMSEGGCQKWHVFVECPLARNYFKVDMYVQCSYCSENRVRML